MVCDPIDCLKNIIYPAFNFFSNATNYTIFGKIYYYVDKDNQLNTINLGIIRRIFRKLGAYDYTQRNTVVKKLYPLTFQPNSIRGEYREKIRDFLQDSSYKDFSFGPFKQGEWEIEYFKENWRKSTYVDTNENVVFSNKETSSANLIKDIQATIQFSYPTYSWQIIRYSENRFILNQPYVSDREMIEFMQVFLEGRRAPVSQQRTSAEAIFEHSMNVFKDIFNNTIYDLRHIDPAPTFYYVSPDQKDLSQWGWELEQEILKENTEERAFLYKFNPSVSNRVNQISLAFGLGYDSEPAIPNKSARN